MNDIYNYVLFQSEDIEIRTCDFLMSQSQYSWRLPFLSDEPFN